MAPSQGSGDDALIRISSNPNDDINESTKLAADEELQRKLEELHLTQPGQAYESKSSENHDVKRVTEPLVAASVSAEDITYRNYKNEDDLDVIIALVAPYLSEPYSVYCYRYFLHGWPQLCILAHHLDFPVGVIVCKQDRHRGKRIRGYIAMLSTHPKYRNLGIASTLVKKVMQTMLHEGAQEIVLETEVSNIGALNLYQKLGFIRLKRLYRFYLNASDAFRLVLPVPKEEWQVPPPGLYDDDYDNNNDNNGNSNHPSIQRPNTPEEWQRHGRHQLTQEASTDEEGGNSTEADNRLRMGLYDSIYA